MRQGHHVSISHLVGAPCLKLQQALICNRTPLGCHLWHNVDGSHIKHVQDAALTTWHWAAVDLAVHGLTLHLLLGDVMGQPACTVIRFGSDPSFI